MKNTMEMNKLNMDEIEMVNGGTGPLANAVGPVSNAVGPVSNAVGPVNNAVGPVDETGPIGYPYGYPY